MYTLSQLFNGFFILYDYLYIFVINIWFEYGECSLTKIYHYLQVLRLSHFNVLLYLYNKEITGPLPTEMGKINQLFKLCCTHYLNSWMDFLFCMIICISLLWIYDLKMESVNWPKYLTTWKFCDFLISKMSCIWKITNSRAHFPLKWEIWLNLVSYCVQIVSTLKWI